jgi:hypothetical protein
MNPKPNVNILVDELSSPLALTKKKTRVGGTPAKRRENMKREEQGLKPLPPTPVNAKRDSNRILPASKKARSQEILAGLLNSKGKAVIQKILQKALTDGDDDQMACLKLVADRIIPADYLSKAANKGNQINISITGIGQAVSVDESDIIDGEIIEDEG